MEYNGRCQPRPAQEDWFRNSCKEELFQVIQNALLPDVPDVPERLKQYMIDIFPYTPPSKDLEFICHNSDKKEIMIAKICKRYGSEEFNTPKLCVRKFCEPHVAYFLENGNKPEILF